jgi:hypothetical protein
MQIGKLGDFARLQTLGGGDASRGRSGGDKPELCCGGCHNKQTYISFQLMTIVLLCRFPLNFVL